MMTIDLPEIVLRTEALRKTFRVGFWGKLVTAVDRLDLEVRKGEIFGFLGPNGAGKTTTLKILMGLIYPTSGRAWILERKVGDVAVKHQVGFLPEAPYFYDYLTAEEFLRFYGQLFGLGGQQLSERIAMLLSTVGLSEAQSLQLRKFSKGMLHRIGIAQALINDPHLVILDEPMSGLDPVGRKEIRDLVLLPGQDQLNEVLDLIRARQAMLISVTPQKSSLEDLFMREVQQLNIPPPL